jgi:hypothetical protein
MTITVDFSRLHPAAYETWTAIARLVASTNTQTWAVVGGQMVAIHATVWGVELPRATDDGDIVVNVGTLTRNALRDVANALVADGFEGTVARRNRQIHEARRQDRPPRTRRPRSRPGRDRKGTRRSSAGRHAGGQACGARDRIRLTFRQGKARAGSRHPLEVRSTRSEVGTVGRGDDEEGSKAADRCEPSVPR